MHRSLRFTICLLLPVVLAASGCGSTKKAASVATTASTPINGGTTGPTGTPTQPATQSTTPTTPKPTTTQGQKSAPAQPAPQPTTTTKSVPQHKLRIKPAPKSPPHGKYEYPIEAQSGFISLCTSGGASKSSCECIIRKFESRKVEEGQSLSELLGVEVALKNGLRYNRRARQYATECNSVIH